MYRRVKSRISRLWSLPFLLVAGGLLLLVPVAAGCGGSQPRVVLYCAQDRDFAEFVIDDFTKRTGLAVTPHFDTEKTKSVSLYQELLTEAKRPRCDVFWNNEILSTIRLQRQNLLEPYDSPSAKPFPASDRAADNTWTAFATRARVLLVNTKLVPAEAERPRSLLDLTQPRWKGKVAMSKPMYGSSATQAACLFEVLGKEKAQEYYHALHENQVQIVGGNKAAAEAVGTGQVAVSVTDTDDAIDEVEKGRPVVIIFPDRESPPSNRMGTLFIPNTVAIIRGCPNPEGARRLVDCLLRPEVEKHLAESASHQIPLNPAVKANLPAQILTPKQAKPMQVDWGKAADLWDETQTFLIHEFAGP